MLEFAMFVGEPDSKHAGSSRFACETHGQNAGISRVVNTVRMLELWGFVMICTVKMPVSGILL